MIVILGAVVLALPLFIPTDAVRAEVISRIEQATGRQARIDGPISISIFPTAHLSAEGIGLAGLTGNTEAFSVDSVSFGLSLLPLLSGNVEINALTITRPHILVTVAADGSTNWTAAASQSDSASSPKSMDDLINSSEGGAPAGDALAALDRLSIGKVTIVDGSLTYRDQATGGEEKLTAMNLVATLPDIRAGGTIEGSFTWHDAEEKVKLAIGKRPDPARLAAIPLDLSLSSDVLDLSAKGVALDGDTLFAGTAEASGGSLADLAGRFGTALPAAPAYGKFSANLRLTVTAKQTKVDQFTLDLGGTKLSGGAIVNTAGARPGIGLRLKADTIDTAAFAAEAGKGGGGSTGGAIDFAPLDLVDANVDFTANAIQLGSVALTNLGLDVKIAGGSLQSTIRSVTVNGAPGSGSLTIERGGKAPVIGGAIKMSGLDVAGLMKLAGVSAPVTGTAGLDVNFKTSGATTSALADNLDGSGKITLTNGTVSGLGLADSVGGDKAADKIENVDLTAAFKSLASPVSANGSLTWRGTRFDVSATADPRKLIGGEASNITLKATSKRLNLAFTGKASEAGLGSGKISLSTPSLRDLLAWVGRPIGAGQGLQAFSIEGSVALSKDTFSFDKAAFTLDKSSGIGTGKVVFGAKPTVTAGLSMKLLDVTPYLAASGASGGGGGGWSTAKIDFGGLKAVDANLNLKAEQILANKIKIGPATLSAKLAGGKLSAELSDMTLYNGKGTGALAVDGAAATPAVSASFRLDGLSALPFLTDALGFTRIEGTGAFSFEVKASGASQAALVKALDGKGAMEFRDGAIRGINIAEMFRNLSIQSLLGGQQGDTAKTDFSRLGGSFTIAKGVLSNQDMVLIGPLIRATGAGTVDLGNRTLSYRVEPKIVASLQGQGGQKDLEGLTLPFRIEGSFDQPRFVPEFQDILKNPNKALEQIQKLGGGIFNNIGKGASQPSTKAQPDTNAAPAADTANPPAESSSGGAAAPSDAAGGQAPATEAPADNTAQPPPATDQQNNGDNQPQGDVGKAIQLFKQLMPPQ